MNLLFCNFWTIITSIGSLMCGVFTLLLYCLGKKQLKKIVSSNELDVYYKLKRDFNSSKSEKLYNCLKGGEFEVKKDYKGLPYLTEIHNESLSDGFDYSLSDELLNHIEDVCIFYDKGLINKEIMIEGYGTYVIVCFESEKIKDYIQQKREFFKNNNLHTGLEKLYRIVKNG